MIVSGNAERDVQPDRASWSITAEATATDEREAFNECSRQAKELMDALREATGHDGKVSTTYVRVSPRWDTERKRHVGYGASTTVSAESELDRAGAVAQKALAVGVSRVHGPSFEISDPEPIKAELLAEAVESGRRKAEILAKASGRELGRVLWIRESGLDLGESESGGVLVIEKALHDRVVEPEIVASDQTVSVDLVIAFEFAD